MSDLISCSRSTKSGKLVFPPVPAQSPAAPRFEPATVANEATLYSYTTIHPSPKSGLPPFSLGYADFGDQLRVFGKLDLPAGEKPMIGMPLRLESQLNDDADATQPAYLLQPLKA